MRINIKTLIEFSKQIFIKCGLNDQNALISSEVLAFCDSRGIYTHGNARLARYVNGFLEKKIDPNAKHKVVKETKTTALIDACGAMGMPVSKFAMDCAIKKAKDHDLSFVTVKNSNHFGVGSYYSSIALKHGLIGIVLTNTAAIGIPTNGIIPMFGTNPISVTIPSKSDSFSLDISSTIIMRGRVEQSLKEGSKLPFGVAINKSGEIEQDPSVIIKCLEDGDGGGLLPIGGIAEDTGSHKGYGIAILVDILTGILSGFKYGRALLDTPLSATRMSHSFMALNIEAFRDLDDFKKDVEDMLIKLNNSYALNGKKVYYAGEQSNKKEKESILKGVYISESTFKDLKELKNKFDIDIDM